MVPGFWNYIRRRRHRQNFLVRKCFTQVGIHQVRHRCFSGYLHGSCNDFHSCVWYQQSLSPSERCGPSELGKGEESLTGTRICFRGPRGALLRLWFPMDAQIPSWNCHGWGQAFQSHIRRYNQYDGICYCTHQWVKCKSRSENITHLLYPSPTCSLGN